MNPEQTPNQPNQTPQPAPVQPVQPVQPIAPASGGAPQVPVQPVAPAYQSGGTANPASHKTLWIVLGIGGGIALLFILGIALMFSLVFSAAAQASAASRAFMDAATTGNTQQLYTLTHTTSNDEKAFLANASAAVKGSGYHQTAMTMQNNAAYFLYDLTGAPNKHARTTLDKTSGHWAVTGFVYSNDPLSLVPSSGSSVSEQTTGPTSSTSTQSTATACLKDEDVAPVTGGGEAFSSDSFDNTSRTYTIDTMFFQADTTTYTYPDQAAEFMTKMGSFYTSNSNKEFTIHLTGKAHDVSPTSSGVQLAHQRVAKIESDLEAKGVPANRFVEEAPQQSADYNDGSERNVDVDIVMKLPCATASPSQTF